MRGSVARFHGNGVCAGRRTAVMRRLVPLTLVGLLVAGCGSSASAPAPAPAPARTKTPAAQAGSAAKPPAAPAPASTSKKLTKVSFETVYLPAASEIPFYLALERGYYKDEGLDVHLTNGKGSVLTASQVGAGQYDIGQAGLTAVALARSKGAQLRSFMSEFTTTTDGLFTAKKESLTQWKSLYGKKILLSPGSPDNFLLKATLKRLKLDPNKVNLVLVSARNKMEDYISGRGDAVATDLASTASHVLPHRASNFLWFADVVRTVGDGLFARTSYIQSHPKVIRGFAAGSLRAIAALAQSPKAIQEAADYMVRVNPNSRLKSGELVSAWKLYQKFVGAHPGVQSAAVWQTSLQLLHQYAGLKGDMNAADYYTNAYLPAASK